MNYSSQSDRQLPVGAYLLAGGASRRMGIDKALLLFDGHPLLVQTHKLLASIVPDPQLVAPVGRYEQLGFSPLVDRRPGCGPMAGIETALIHSGLEWNLILACDLPYITRDWLIHLVETALAAPPRVACVSTGDNPLLAVWRKSALPTVQRALDSSNFRLRDLMKPLDALNLIPPDPKILANWNRPEDLPENPSEGKANFDC